MVYMYVSTALVLCLNVLVVHQWVYNCLCMVIGFDAKGFTCVRVGHIQVQFFPNSGGLIDVVASHTRLDRETLHGLARRPRLHGQSSSIRSGGDC